MISTKKPNGARKKFKGNSKSNNNNINVRLKSVESNC